MHIPKLLGPGQDKHICYWDPLILPLTCHRHLGCNYCILFNMRPLSEPIPSIWCTLVIVNIRCHSTFFMSTVLFKASNLIGNHEHTLFQYVSNVSNQVYPQSGAFITIYECSSIAMCLSVKTFPHQLFSIQKGKFNPTFLLFTRKFPINNASNSIFFSTL